VPKEHQNLGVPDGKGNKIIKIDGEKGVYFFFQNK
jgi:hypothetical protein